MSKQSECHTSLNAPPFNVVAYLEASAANAHAALDDYARRYPEMVAAQWYVTSTQDELAGFYRAWAK